MFFFLAKNNSAYSMYVFAVVWMLTACGSNELPDASSIEGTPATANFEVCHTGLFPKNEIFLENTSSYSGTAAWSWDFGDGRISRKKNVTIKYENPGKYNVSLSLTLNGTKMYRKVKTITIAPFTRFVPWKEGYLDIHHINTGRGDATFMIFPEGTTLLFDAGDKEVPGSDSNHDYPRHPNNTKVAGEWIAEYIKNVIPKGKFIQVDYAVISHFHIDHMGRINKLSPLSSSGIYQLGGITQVGDLVRIGKIIDRGYPDYNFPVDLKQASTSASVNFDDIQNYRKFTKYKKEHEGLRMEGIEVGSSEQLRLLNNAAYNVTIRNVYANQEIWIGDDSGTTQKVEFYEPLINANGEWNENPLSIALKISYGDFDYYTGGDVTGTNKSPNAFDVESTLGRIVGPVDVMNLNHHGFKNETNENFVSLLIPSVAVQQTTNVAHISEEVLETLKEVGAACFISNVAPNRYRYLSEYYKSMSGHVLVRVYENGNHFEIITLSDNETGIHQMNRFKFQSK
jgi:beta-lactamase superfamily II metal-dependent hydrolase